MMSQIAQPERETARQMPPSLAKVIAVVMLGALMMQLDMTMTNIATRTLVRDFQSPLTTIQWVSTGYLLAMASTIPLAGWALERFGARAEQMVKGFTGRPRAAVLSGMAYGSGVACCGLAQASEFSATVFPFILRAVRLIGIDSVYCPLQERERAWEEIGKTRPLKGLEEITGFYSLEEVPELAQALLDGKLRGRALV